MAFGLGHRRESAIDTGWTIKGEWQIASQTVLPHLAKVMMAILPSSGPSCEEKWKKEASPRGCYFSSVSV